MHRCPSLLVEEPWSVLDCPRAVDYRSKGTTSPRESKFFTVPKSHWEQSIKTIQALPCLTQISTGVSTQDGQRCPVIRFNQDLLGSLKVLS